MKETVADDLKLAQVYVRAGKDIYLAYGADFMMTRMYTSLREIMLTWIAVYAIERAPVWYAALYPLGAATVAFIMLRSAFRGRRIEWRGRVYRAQK